MEKHVLSVGSGHFDLFHKIKLPEINGKITEEIKLVKMTNNKLTASVSG